MKYIFLLLFFSPNLYGQTNDTLKGPFNMIDGVYIDEYYSCSFDTTAQLFSCVKLIFSNPDSTEYTFEEGTNTYLVLILRTKNCRCSDCSFFKKIIIELKNLENQIVMSISSENTTWIYWNSWIFPKKESDFNGQLILDKNCVSLSLYKYFDENHTDFILDWLEINNVLIHH